MMELFSLPVIKRALLSLLVAGAFLPIAGAFSVLTKTSFFSAGISHIALAGIAFAYFSGLTPIASALIVTILASYIIWRIGESGYSLHEEVLSLLFSMFMALAVIFFGLSKQYTSDAMSYLFGSPLTVSRVDAYLIFSLFTVYILVVAIFRREIFHAILSRELSMAIGINVSLIKLLLFIFTGLAVVLSMKVVGALVVYGLSIIPPLTAKKFSKHFWQMLLLSCIFGVLSSFIGFIISVYFDVPPGASVVLIASVFYIILLGVKR
ncbi:MAG: metal ABC transporter permease [Candidatus Hydrothermia bacterium]